MPTTYDHLEIRCPRLGGEVKFAYCRRESGDRPCARTITCWQSFFPVEQFLKDNMPEEDWERFTREQPKDKVTTLIDLIEAAKKRRNQG
ncbi:MAG: hypothetical protein JXA41_15365 [Deltaproteobacteria bacterium]|nr:hypothetical protein [Deltaproteobacteria bacterium]